MPSGRRLPGNRGLVIMALLVVGCLLAFAVLTVLVATGWPPLFASDLQIDTALHSIATTTPWLVGLSVVASYTGGPALVSVISTVTVVVLAIRGRLGFALYLATTALGGAALSEVTKGAIERPRPVWVDPLWSAEGASYPSGHSLAGVTNWVVYGVIALMLLPGVRGRVAATALMTWGLLMAPSRLVLGVHWPADVVAGWLLGGAWVLAVSVIAVRVATRRAAPPAAPA